MVLPVGLCSDPQSGSQPCALGSQTGSHRWLKTKDVHFKTLGSFKLKHDCVHKVMICTFSNT